MKCPECSADTRLCQCAEAERNAREARPTTPRRSPCRYCQGQHVSHLCPARQSKYRRYTYEARSNGPGTATSFVVYGWGVYPRHSVLAGQDMKCWLDEFDTPDEVIAAYPKAKPSSRWIEQPNTFNHLPDGPDLS